jgi:hypothetical protein
LGTDTHAAADLVQAHPLIEVELGEFVLGQRHPGGGSYLSSGSGAGGSRVFFQEIADGSNCRAELFGRLLECRLPLADHLVNLGDLDAAQVWSGKLQARQQSERRVPAHRFITDAVVVQENLCRVMEPCSELGSEVGRERCHAGAEGVTVDGEGCSAGGQAADSLEQYAAGNRGFPGSCRCANGPTRERPRVVR